MDGSLSSGSSGPRPEHFVEHFLDHPVLLGRGHRHALVFEQTLDHAADFGAQAILGNGGNAFEVQHADQLAVNLALQLKGAVGGAHRSGIQRRARNGRTKIGSQVLYYRGLIDRRKFLIAPLAFARGADAGRICC